MSNTKKIGSAIQKAMNHVLAYQNSDGYPAGAFLPSLGVLAGAARVSRTSMWKAVNILSGKGVVTVVPGGKFPFAWARLIGR